MTRYRADRLTRAATGLAVVVVVMLTSCTSAESPGGHAHASAVGSDSRAPGSKTGRRSGFPPVIHRTGSAPTGYAVTFRYWDPSATAVSITGEWSFSSPAHTTTTSSQAIEPSHWAPGDVPIVHPNTLQGRWPVTAMTKDDTTGVWSATVPLPSGTFTYGFLVNCSAPTASGCSEVPDPSNMPWNSRGNSTAGTAESNSQVYVPSDPTFQTVNYSWQAPNPIHGNLVDAAYPSSAAKQKQDANRLAIYTPPGYNARRAVRYPTLYLSHGYGGNEVDWSTTGVASNILDNLIDSKQVEPMIVVMTNFNGFGDDCITNKAAWLADYDSDLIDHVIPYIQAHYNASPEPSRRAFVGLSCGGDLANSLLFQHTGEFGYYGILSPYETGLAGLAPAIRAKVIAYFVARRHALDNVGVFLGGGLQDPVHVEAAAEEAILNQADIPLDATFINGGHEWYVWRILLHDFLIRTAFTPTPR